MTSGGASAALLDRAARVVPGGVNTARRRIEPPLCLRRGRGAHVEDVDGNRYIDFHAAYGAIVLGHAHPVVNDRVRAVMDEQVLFGVGVTEPEAALAEAIVRHVPSVEQVALCGSGSEATYHAIRLARAVTGRDRLIRFEGCYHGFHDAVLPGAGMLGATADATPVCPYNDLDSVRATLERHADEVAAVIVEPIAHNAASILPNDDFLPGLRTLCDDAGALLIFDEVITGFRHGLGGCQGICGVRPDLTTLGKALANGYPLAAVGGRAEHLERFNTTATGDVPFAGTYNGGAIAVAAALGTLEVLEGDGAYARLFSLGARMRRGLSEVCSRAGVPHVVSGYGSIYSLLFMEGPLDGYEDLRRDDRSLGAAYRRGLIARGVLELPERSVRNHVSLSHTAEDVDRALSIAAEALAAALDRRTVP